VAASFATLDEAMAVEHDVDGADGGPVHIRIEPGEPLSDLRGAPGRLLLLQAVIKVSICSGSWLAGHP
jgi:hypothetical protein